MKNWIRIRVFFLITFLFTVDSALAANYYVSSNDGNDKNSGRSISDAWATIDSANKTLQGGDTVFIREGTYYDGIKPSNSGYTNNKITYKNYNNEIVNIDAKCFIAKNHIVLDGFNIKPKNPPTNYSYIIDIRGNFNLIKNIKILNHNDPWIERVYKGIKEDGIVIQGGDDNIIENCEIRNLSNHGITSNSDGTNVANRNQIRNCISYGHYGNAITVGHSDDKIAGLLILNNQLGGSLVSDGIQCNGNFTSNNYKNRGVIIKGNTISNNAENGIDIKGTKHIVIEDNYIHGNRGDNNGEQDCVSNCDGKFDRNAGMGGVTRGANQPSENVIIRHNIVYDNKGGLHIFEGYRVYNNNILGNNRDYTGPNSTYVDKYTPAFPGIFSWSSNIGIKNNIIGGNKSGDLVIAFNSVDIDHNIYEAASSNYTKLSKYINGQSTSFMTFSQWRLSLEQSNGVIGKDLNSKVGRPKFINVSFSPINEPDKYNFNLSNDSLLAIDAGGHLTTAINAGSGNVIPVEDALYFTDGFGVISGDTIMIGSQVVEIENIDYTTNKLSVDRSISWKAFEKIYFCKDQKCFSGAEPEIGALEVEGNLNSPVLKIVYSSSGSS